jgi:ribosomal protein S18 acetylase RimI-like enzyme
MKKTPSCPLVIRAAKPSDLEGMETVERLCFPEHWRSSRKSLSRSLVSPAQSVRVAVARTPGGPQVVGAMILHHHRQSIRIFSLAVRPEFRRDGTGRRLVNCAVRLARQSDRRFVTLEADRFNPQLTDWYAEQGFEPVRIAENYYSPGHDAVRMRRAVQPVRRKKGGRVGS